MEIGSDRMKSISIGENPERPLPGRCTVVITIGNNNDATQLHTYEVQWRL